jgi:glycosyltransferase involved in cell wall biosynthesis
MFNITNKLAAEGHRVVPFSVKHQLNEPTPHEKYFLSSLGDSDSVYFDEIKKTPGTISKMLGRNFYSLEAKRKAREVVQAEQIDVAYVMNFLRWMSPSILDGFKKQGIPIVVRISDFIYMCPEGHFLRNGKVCTLCQGGNHWHSVKHKCIQDSMVVSAVNALAVSLHKAIGYLDKVDAFVVPSSFTLNKMAEAGIPESKLHHIPTFIDESKIQPYTEPGDYILYFGRVSAEKGVSTLLDAFVKVRKEKPAARLMFAGRSNDGEALLLKERIEKEQIQGVEFTGELQGDELLKIIQQAAFTVVPSIWFDNMPNVLIESFAAGKPVLASNIGSLPELVHPGETGMLFEPGNADDLRDKIVQMLSDKDGLRTMGENAVIAVRDKYTPQVHYDRLMQVFAQIAN